MAELGKILSPMVFPLGNAAVAMSKDTKEKVEKPHIDPLMGTEGHGMAMMASLRSWLMAYACIYHLPQAFGLSEYPAFGPAKTLEFNWMAHIVLRDVIGCWVICGFWDWFLYFGPLKDKLQKYKINPTYPSLAQLKHDAYWSTSASITGAGIEILLCYLWANGRIPMQVSLSENSLLLNMILVLTITHYRIPHFYFMHRAMHPWKTSTIPDFGKFLYKKVHSLHHKSYNPTAFSGTSMHPIESTLYYSAAFIPVIFGLHPVFALAIIVDCGVGAWLGHDGFQWPGNGDYFHLLHHAHFDCNYGAMHVPLDWIFGTFAGNKEEVKKIWE